MARQKVTYEERQVIADGASREERQLRMQERAPGPTRPLRALATVDVTAGAPGTIAIVGNAMNIASVAITAPVLVMPGISYRCAKFTFSTPMPDTDYVISPHRSHGASAPAVGNENQVREVAKTATDFTIGFIRTDANNGQPIDLLTHRFSVLVMR